eukprot:COSAG06_NODE_47731_length_337_cov_0.806723_1_plen_51_part_10
MYRPRERECAAAAAAHVLDLNLGQERPIGPGLSTAAAVGDGAPGRDMLLPF